MTDWTAARERLERQRSEPRESLAHYQRDLRTTHNADWEERAVEAQGDEVLEGLETSALHEIEQIDAAIKRIELVTCGERRVYGEPIGRRRLDALPYAVSCVRCAGSATGG